MSIGRSEVGAGRATLLRDALLTLSRVLAAGQPGGVLSDALEIVVEGLGCGRGATYEATSEGLELIAHRGVPPALRERIERVSRGDPKGKSDGRAEFVAGRAARARRAIVESDAAQNAGLDAKAAEATGWVHAIAAPITIGREVLGVLVVAHPTPDPFGRDALAFVETAANLLALSLDRQRASAKRNDRGASGARIAELGVVGWLALGVADDLREPLNTLGVQLTEVGERLRLLRPHVGGPKRPMDHLETLLVDADGSLDRARKIHERLMGLVREEEASVVSLADVAREAVSLVGPTFAARGVGLDVRAKVDAFVTGRRSQLTQLVVQLLANTLDSAPPGFSMAGAVVVTVTQDGGRAMLAVEEPRLTSNPARARDGESSVAKPALGIGLTLARQLAALHHGALDLATAPSGGSEVKLSLPSSRAQVKAPGIAPPSSNQPASEPQAEGALVWVDDDPLFLRSIKRLLKGWRVDTARSASEAEALLATATPVRVFCDLGLPDRAGYELHQKLSQVRPDIARRFVFVTGGALTASVADYLVASGCPTLLKPIRAEEVEALLKQTPGWIESAVSSAPPAARGRPRSKRARAGSTPLAPRGSAPSTPLVPQGTLPTVPPRSEGEANVPTTRRASGARRGTIPGSAATAPPTPAPRRAATVPHGRRAKKED